MYTYIYGEVFELHRPKLYHPENPTRLRIAIEGLKNANLWTNDRVLPPTEATLEDVLKVHDREYVEEVVKSIEYGMDMLDADTYICEDSLRAALAAFGSAMKAVDIVMEKSPILVFVLARPPGHHAGVAGRAMGAPTLGFCIFNNIAGAVRKALDLGLDPVVVIDIDVHHGNGTQEIFWNEPRVIHIDIHEYGIYPGTGFVEDIGGKDAKGTKINIPLPPYSTSDDYIYVWREIVEPIVENVKPRILMVSAGFDAYSDDGLADMEVDEKFYSYAGTKLYTYSKKFMGVVATLEGGYSKGLRYGLPALVRGYVSHDEDSASRVEECIEPSQRVKRVVKDVKKVISSYLQL